MGIWSLPTETKKAIALRNILDQPLLRVEAEEKLYNIIGDDQLFLRFNDYKPHDDVRTCVLERLGDLLGNPPSVYDDWDPEALSICEKLCSQSI